MLTTEICLSFFGIAVLLALAPGPDNLFVLMQSAMWGPRAGMFVVLGLCTGLMGHTLAVAVGLAARNRRDAAAKAATTPVIPAAESASPADDLPSADTPSSANEAVNG